ncbi:MAG: dolichyl-phosphate-mannose--protein mannosyltransferase, partial [Clostridia bacterium]|nr:dolichyl-phosphate-mannose--protein mannosyltransferase [Clostridia bacterium]
GNPAVWWTGLIALILILFHAAYKRRTPKTWLLVLIGFASQFLPWVLVPRSTFIYHYFASVPFIILCTVLVLDWMKQHDRQTARWTSILLVAAALLLFAAFYPLESGVTAPKAYAQYLRWFKWYNF